MMTSTDPGDAESQWQRLVPLLDDAMNELAEPDRRAILLRFYEGLPPRAIASELGVPVTTVKSWIQRGLEKLRESLRESG